MNNEQIVKDVKTIIKDYLLDKRKGNDAKMVDFDNNYLLSNIEGMLILFSKAKTILKNKMEEV